MNAKVTILTEGGSNIGCGHISRCSSVYQVFEEKGFAPELIVYGDKDIEGLLEGKRYRLLDWVNDRGVLGGVLKDSDIAIVDSYLADSKTYDVICQQVKTAAYFDDELRIDYPKGFVINGAVSAEDMNYPAKNDVGYLLGTSYFPLKKEFCNPRAKDISKNVETLMITCGGSDMYNATGVIQRIVNESYPELHKKIIATNLFSNISEIKELQDANTELLFDLDGNAFRETMLASDIAISAAGQTLYELASVGLPTIAVCVTGNQSQNVFGWCKTEAMKYAGKYDDSDFELKLKTALETLMPCETRSGCSKKARQLIDGKGADRIYERLVDSISVEMVVNKGALSNSFTNHLTARPATEDDVRDIFNLANDRIVRESSFESDAIVWEQHLKWFDEKLSDDNCWLFVIESQGQFAGQVRFDKGQDDTAVISISLTKNVRGLKLSSEVIETAIAKINDACSDIDTITAYIKNGNTPSIRTFEKAGFGFLENTTVKGYEAKVYTRSIRGD